LAFNVSRDVLTELLNGFVSSPRLVTCRLVAGADLE
jgi:hypothetical protein